MRGPTTIGGRLLFGFLGLFLVSAIGVTLALRAAEDVRASLLRVAAFAEQGRRLAEVGGLVRDYYMHQAHIALGLHAGEHLAETRRARSELEAAVVAYEEVATTPADARRVGIREPLEALDRLLDERFLPALQDGRKEEALAAHHDAVRSVAQALSALNAEEHRITDAIHGAQSAAERRSQRALAESIAALAGALFLALGVALWMSRAISLPVGRLRAAAHALPDAPPDTRVPEDGPAEVAALGATLNGMLSALEAQRRARAEAETLAALGRVAAGIAHEINNPLGVILGHARLIERAGGEATDDAAAIAREARLCQSIVRDLLDYARPGTVHPEAADLADVARAAVERAGGGHVEAAAACPEIQGDARRLEQLVYNLVSNGLAFGTKVAVDVRPADEGVRLTVRDDGPGVPEADLERIFEPFHSTRPGGTGLGLAIARSIATAHGGTLRACAGGAGGHFELWLPFGNARN